MWRAWLVVVLLGACPATSGCRSEDSSVVQRYARQAHDCRVAGTESAADCGGDAYEACMADPHWRHDLDTASTECADDGILKP